MKIKSIDNKIIIYIPKMDKNNSLDNIDDLEVYFRKLFLKLRNIYNIKLSGYYNITIYINKIYGNIIELVKEKNKYQSYLSDKIDMQIEIIDNSDFLYKIDNYYKSDKTITYKLDSDIYLKVLDINDIDLSILLEHSSIIYGEELEKIKYKIIQI